MNDQYLRLAADFENFKKRSARDREILVSCANERFALDMLEVLDNFERAIKSDEAHLREGVQHIHQLLDARLQRNGITPVDALKNNSILQSMRQSLILRLSNRRERLSM